VQVLCGGWSCAPSRMKDGGRSHVRKTKRNRHHSIGETRDLANLAMFFVYPSS
jgi:hypothetical protein